MWLLFTEEKEKNEHFGCKLLEKCYMPKVGLEYHQRVYHSSGGAQVKCTVCESVFGHDMSLKRHMKIHDEDAELF